MPWVGEGGKALGRAETYWSGEAAVCTEKRPEEGSSSFDRQVTGRRGDLAGKHTGQPAERIAQIVTAEERTDLSLPAEGVAAEDLQLPSCLGFPQQTWKARSWDVLG